MSKNLKTNTEVVRINGKLKEVLTVVNQKGDILHKIINPLMVEVHARDVVQVLIGASILAVPIGFTQEAWDLGTSLPMINVYGVSAISLLFISIFVYYNFYRGHFKDHILEFIKRILTIYILSFLVVSAFLTLIQIAPWQTDVTLAIKRIILVSFPASMSAAVTDMIK